MFEGNWSSSYSKTLLQSDKWTKENMNDILSHAL